MAAPVTGIEHDLIQLIISFVSSMAAFAVWTHLDLENYWEQRHIRHGRRLEERERERQGL